MNSTNIKSENYFKNNTLEDEKTKDYYKSSDSDIESIGILKGGINKKLKLQEKEVTMKQYNRMMNGFNPNDGSKMLKNAGNCRHGVDYTFTAPKDVSIIFALADEQHQKEILDVFHKATASGMEVVASKMQYRNQKGKKKSFERARAISYIEFTHHSNRNNEMNLHAHEVTQQYVQGKDGKFYSMEDSQVRQDYNAPESAFLKSLAQGMKSLGYELEHGKGYAINIKGIDESVRKDFSTRSAQIEKYLADNPNASIEDAKTKTRNAKSEISVEENVKNWKKDLLDKHGLSQSSIKKMRTYKDNSQQYSIEDVLRITADRKKKDKHLFTSKDIDNTLNILEGFDSKIDRISLRKELFTSETIEKTNGKKYGNQVFENKAYVTPQLKQEHKLNKNILNKANLAVASYKLGSFDKSAKFDDAYKNFKKKQSSSKKPSANVPSSSGGGVQQIRVSLAQIRNSLTDLLAQLHSLGESEKLSVLCQIAELNRQLTSQMEQLAKEEAKEIEQNMKQTKNVDMEIER
ncbi:MULTISPECIES: MobF family relaxase [Burkholderia]|uniref:MobF family relaxase n=1 Tax=Burkholderia TaxID=32008 RepID=UPI000B7A6F15|nr:MULTISPECIES: MobF family relaxase [Burkholderia]OXJ00858.1 hypothetical protein CFB41_14350 [Burkholderia sp. AU33803]PRD87502.1 hypothetical protein C6P88_28950 [Burkholderia contaminans]